MSPYHVTDKHLTSVCNMAQCDGDKFDTSEQEGNELKKKDKCTHYFRDCSLVVSMCRSLPYVL